MTPEKLSSYINNPQQLNEASIFDMTLLADKYPFFQTAQLLRIKNLHNISPEAIKPVLNFTAAYVTDRKILYYLLHPIQNLSAPKEQKFPEKDFKDTMEENIADTLDTQLEHTGDSSELEFTTSFDVKKEYGTDVELKEYVVRITDDGPELMELIPNEAVDEKFAPEEITTEIPESEDLLTVINKGSSVGIPVEDDHLSENQKKDNALIDNFISSKPKIVPEASAKRSQDISEDSVQENEHYLTDTLAQIYLKQGNYAKAIFAYEKLSLKFPEKSSYFADQIIQIKNKLDKTK